MTSETEKIRFGTFLAQGAAGNIIVTYLSFIAIVLYFPNGYDFLLLFFLPFYLIVMGIIGAVIGTVIWLAGWLLESRPGVISRAAIGILFPASLVALVALLLGSILDQRLLMGAIGSGLFYGLPAALVAGSRFNPLRRIIFGFGEGRARRDLSRRFACIAGLPLRVASAFGLMESLLWLACLISSRRLGAGFNYGGENYLPAGLAILYFAVSGLNSCAPPRKLFLLITSVLVNTPLAIWTLDPHRARSDDTDALAIMAWALISVWVLFVAGQMISSGSNHSTPHQRPRLIPLTLCEVQIRQALNRW